MEFFIIVVAIMAFFVISGWRKGHVITSASDSELIEELKSRAYQRKLRLDADAEVDQLLKR